VKVVDTMKKYQCSLMIISFSLLLFSCKTNKQVQSSQNATSNTNVSQQPEVVDFGKSPFISPEASISKMIVEDGFEVKLIAAEPLVSTPVAMLFDDKARMWVVEMTGYMPDTTGAGEDIPNGKIVILDDKNGDGVYDDRKVFLDSLVLPRAICFVDGGILVAEPSNLWFYEISNDKPVNKLLVDDKYAVGGNVEHQPNGLLRALDNWIYNAKSDRRYRRIGGASGELHRITMADSIITTTLRIYSEIILHLVSELKIDTNEVLQVSMKNLLLITKCIPYDLLLA
jgi:hypothetical protein